MPNPTPTTENQTPETENQAENPSGNPPEPPPADQTPTDAEPPAGKSGDEARKYRQRAQAAEAERAAAEAGRAALQERVDALSRGEVERLIERNEGGQYDLNGMHNPADPWAIGRVDLADVTDDNGAPDPAKIREKVHALRAERPYLFKLDPLAVIFGHTTAPSETSPQSGGELWGKTLQSARRGTL